jgi:hypothetical protein
MSVLNNCTCCVLKSRVSGNEMAMKIVSIMMRINANNAGEE